MKTATINELKKELATVPPAQLAALCLRLAKYKKENKELLTYLLFDADDEQGYINSVKTEIDAGFEGMKGSNLHNAKKQLRKILRITNKHIRYMGSKPAEAELLIYFCECLSDSGLLSKQSTVLQNLFAAQLKKIVKVVVGLHEDLQYDYRRQVEPLLELLRS
ncbi:hypothetical protein [Chitinophaga flava]|uniref:Uncharacterized protein n=1 Tax=Chitinophaga flava TaxID=2259036 RepID=A0A365XV67_9BACT|nr:hypothetical protein [Chitinophaga flava]RBL90213.1 hypothetical protein DF182_27495 [Chitinophaga flava]